MNLYVSSGNFIDYDSLELMYIYIDYYNVFRKIGFSLHPAYTIREIHKSKTWLKIEIKKKKNFVDLFEDEHVNIKIICGKNGSGKTTLLSLLERSNTEQCIYLFKDKNDVWGSSKKIDVLYDNRNFSLNTLLPYPDVRLCYACPSHKNMQMPEFSLNRNIVDFYNAYPSLFEHILSKNDSLITHFNVDLYPGSINDLFSRSKDFLEEQDLYSIENDPVQVFLISGLLDFDSNDFVKKIKLDGLSWPASLQECCKKEKIYEKVKVLQKNLFGKDFCLTDCIKVHALINELSDLLRKLLCLIVGEEFPIMYDFKHFVYLRGFSKKHGKKRYIDNLSEGEYFKLRYSYNLIHSIAQSDRMLLVHDEPDRGLHPEWCRRFFKDYLAVYKKLLKFEQKNVENFNPKKRMSFFFATHSPFLLSDVTNDYVIYLEKNNKGVSREVKYKKETFAGNIGEMFSTNFFMNRSIGARATDILKHKLFSSSLTSLERKKYRMLLNYIGDDLLKQLLKEKWLNYEAN